ncbi:MAG: hypothetical protein K2K94_10320 [Muribaculaceae bacterium]|nr:hypothetical protein [Muribaculaceae bacterium]
MTKFKVISLDWQSFSAACKKLRMAIDNSGFKPDAVIAIPRGGSNLLLYGWHDISNIEITILKPSKFSLKKYASKILRSLPLALRNRLRIWDANRLVKRTGHMADTVIKLPAIDPSIKKLLILDDAVDSGATLQAIVSEIKFQRQDIDIRSAAITVTSENPVCMPDYYLYHNFTLVRMPWSIDAK